MGAITIIMKMQLTFSGVYDIVLLGNRTQSVPSGKVPRLWRLQTRMHGSLDGSGQPRATTNSGRRGAAAACDAVLKARHTSSCTGFFQVSRGILKCRARIINTCAHNRKTPSL